MLAISIAQFSLTRGACGHHRDVPQRTCGVFGHSRETRHTATLTSLIFFGGACQASPVRLVEGVQRLLPDVCGVTTDILGTLQPSMFKLCWKHKPWAASEEPSPQSNRQVDGILYPGHGRREAIESFELSPGVCSRGPLIATSGQLWGFRSLPCDLDICTCSAKAEPAVVVTVKQIMLDDVRSDTETSTEHSTIQR